MVSWIRRRLKRLFLYPAFLIAFMDRIVPLTPSIGVLIGTRMIIQSLGAGCMMAVFTAMIKDCFEEKKRNAILGGIVFSGSPGAPGNPAERGTIYYVLISILITFHCQKQPMWKARCALSAQRSF